MIELLQTFMNAVTASSSSVSASSSSSSTNNESTTEWSFSKSSLWPIKNSSSSSSSSSEFNCRSIDLKTLPKYSLTEVSEHWQQDDCWIIVEDLVYNITEFLDEHPGGQYIVMEHAGRDATLVFRGSRHSQDAYNMLSKYLIGVLVEEERMYLDNKTTTRTTSTILSSMDDDSTSLYGSSPKPSKGL